MQEKEENRKARTTKQVTISGDSIIKCLNLELVGKVSSDCKVHIKHFSGAATDYMKDFVKPSLRNPRGHLILHVRTNDLISNQTSEEMSTSIINLASSMKGGPMMSGYHQLYSGLIYEERCKVNYHLRDECLSGEFESEECLLNVYLFQ